ELAGARTETDARLAILKTRWEKERDLVTKVREVREKLESSVVAERAAEAKENRTGEGAAAAEAAAAAADAMRAELATFNTELDAIQGETPLVRVCVDAGIVGEVISGWTGIPVGKMMRDQMQLALK